MAMEVKPPNQNDAGVHRGRLLEAIIAVALCGLSLLIFKIVSMFHSLSEQLLGVLGGANLTRARAGWAAFIGLTLALFATVPATAGLLSSMVGWVGRPAVLLSGLALLVTGAPRALAAATRLRATGEPASAPLELWFADRMMHAEDAVWPSVILIMSLLILPVAVVLVVPHAFGMEALAVYAAVLWVTWKPATDLEHADSHYLFFNRHRAKGRFERTLFKTLDLYWTYVFMLASARMPHWYEVQHVVIHHAEDNGPEDTQSTLGYDRASFVDFAICANRFAVSGLLSFDVFRYLIRKRRSKAIQRLTGGMLLFWGMIFALLLIDWRVAITILAARYVSGIISSMGFFQEHGIVDIAKHSNIYRNSLHYLAPDNNHGSRGEDFHIAHHLAPGRHWTDYESQVVAAMQRYAAEGAVAFLDGPGHIDIYYRLLWRRDFAGLARYFIVFGQPDIPPKELAGLLRVRTLPVARAASSDAGAFDILLGRGASYLLG